MKENDALWFLTLLEKMLEQIFEKFVFILQKIEKI